MSDQDTTAPTVNVTIKRVEVTTGDDPDRFIHQLNKAVGRELAAPSSSALGWGTLPEHRWCRWLAGNIREAALEEMRVRAAMLRLVREAPCSSCGAASTSVVCSTPVCRFHAGPKTCPYAAHHQPCDCNGEGGDA